MSRHQEPSVESCKDMNRCRDKRLMSRHQEQTAQNCKYQEVTTLVRCRDVRFNERRCHDNIRMSRQQLYREDVATTPGCRDNSCFQDMSQQHRGSCDKNCDKNGDRNRCRDKRLMSRQHQYTGPVHSSPKECIGIRAQLRNPINKQLPRRKRKAVGDAEQKIWVA